MGELSIPSQSDRQSAERVLQAAPTDRPNEMSAPLRELAAEYERVRREMKFGEERTRKMSGIASRMKRLALVAVPYLPQLTRSSSPGERLAAVIILQMKFDPDYIEWLANRLIRSLRSLDTKPLVPCSPVCASSAEPEQKRIKTAVQAAMKKRTELNLKSEEQRDKLVEQILAP